MDTGTFEPRPFQARLAHKVLQGENIILQAPTGSGKSWAALQPFLGNLLRPLESEQVMPRTCRYAVPLRSLTDQLYSKYRSVLHHVSQVGMHDVVRGYEDYGIDPVAQQTGERRGDPYFQSALTFCTIDQLLAAYLGIPYGVSRMETNIKVAGVAGSYIVLDEWHLFPLHSIDPTSNRWELKGARATSLAMLRMLQSEGLVRYVLMTATLSTKMVNRLAGILKATVEDLHQGSTEDRTEEQAFAEELHSISGHRSRTWRKVPKTVLQSTNDILEQHLADRQRWGAATTLVICNTVERAQQVYLRLWERSLHMQPVAPDMLLHSRFTAERRTAQGEWIGQHLGKRAWKDGNPNAIMVATQVVEVGLDFSVRRLHTEIAPANSLIQRAGRCARFDGQHGEVLVYRTPEQRGWSLPYPELLCLDTWEAIEDRTKVMGFVEEQDLINAVHTAEDDAFLDRFEEECRYIRRQVLRGWQDSNELGASRDLIRDVEQVDVIIHDNPKSIDTEPWRYQAFGVHPGLLRGRFTRLQELQSEYGADYVLKAADLIGQERKGDAAEQDCRATLRCDWHEMSEPEVQSAALIAAPMLAMPSALVHYSDRLGFAFRDFDRLPELRQFEQGREAWCSGEVPSQAVATYRPYTIEACSYGYHTAGLVKAYQHVLADELRWPARVLEDRLGYQHGTIDKAVRVLLAYHDLGKLTVGWQRWAIMWQQLLAQADPGNYVAPPAGVLLAKTDYDSRKHRGLQGTSKPARPHHAVEGMALAQGSLLQATQIIAPGDGDHEFALTKAIYTAVARHHSVDAVTHAAASLHTDALVVLQAAVAQATGREPWAQAVQALRPEITISAGDSTAALTVIDERASPEGNWLYFLLARVLRLADRRAELSDMGAYPRLGRANT